MLLSVKEMEVLCVFHAGNRAATIDALKGAVESGQPNPKITDIKSLLEKLSRMADGDVVCLGFDAAK